MGRNGFCLSSSILHPWPLGPPLSTSTTTSGNGGVLCGKAEGGRTFHGCYTAHIPRSQRLIEGVGISKGGCEREAMGGTRCV